VIAEATRVLAQPRQSVWALVAEPFHLPDWWPGYTGVEPDRRGLAENARWTIVRSGRPGLLRRPHGTGLVVIRRVVPARELVWHDLAQRLEAGIRLEDEGGGTAATVWLSGSWWRLFAEGGRSLPPQALARLDDLCETASEL
jgi:uncharacterized protein YndB with AHSA1/START domain